LRNFPRGGALKFQSIKQNKFIPAVNRNKCYSYSLLRNRILHNIPFLQSGQGNGKLLYAKCNYYYYHHHHHHAGLEVPAVVSMKTSVFAHFLLLCRAVR
jgi:hypothetical protein